MHAARIRAACTHPRWRSHPNLVIFAWMPAMLHFLFLSIYNKHWKQLALPAACCLLSDALWKQFPSDASRQALGQFKDMLQDMLLTGSKTCFRALSNVSENRSGHCPMLPRHASRHCQMFWESFRAMPNASKTCLRALPNISENRSRHCPMFPRHASGHCQIFRESFRALPNAPKHIKSVVLSQSFGWKP